VLMIAHPPVFAGGDYLQPPSSRDFLQPSGSPRGGSRPPSRARAPSRASARSRSPYANNCRFQLAPPPSSYAWFAYSLPWPETLDTGDVDAVVRDDYLAPTAFPSAPGDGLRFALPPLAPAPVAEYGFQDGYQDGYGARRGCARCLDSLRW
jgi:hypothetical protein